MARPDMRELWDELARDNAYFYVDNRLDYSSPDLDEFWADGEKTLDGVLDAVGARIEPQDTVVEVGCGVGRLTRPIAARAEAVIAFDVSADMLKLAREHNPKLDNVEWVLGDGTSLSQVDDGAATACFSHVVFQHIPDPEITLGYVREMGRVLRAGGWAAFQISNDPSIHRPRQGKLGRLAARLRGGPKSQDAAAWLGSAVGLADLRRAADEAGMDVQRVTGEGTQFCLVLTRRR